MHLNQNAVEVDKALRKIIFGEKKKAVNNTSTNRKIVIQLTNELKNFMLRNTIINYNNKFNDNYILY
jgi:hypothetical protein